MAAPARRPLPLWVRLMLWMGAGLGLLGLLLTLVPLLFLLWVMGSGEQHDTRALLVPGTVAAVQLAADLDDPGTAAFLDQLAVAYPDMMVRLRRAQGYPEPLARLEALRDSGSLRNGLPGIVPSQATVALVPRDEGEGFTTAAAIDTPRWGRALGLAMRFAAWAQQQSAAADPEIEPFLAEDLAGHRLYRSRDARGDTLWGTVDGTLFAGAGASRVLEDAVARLGEDQPPALPAALEAAHDRLGDARWELWAVMDYQAAVVDEVFPWPYQAEPSAEDLRRMEAALQAPEGVPVEIPPVEQPTSPPRRTCLALQDPALVSAVAGGLDVVGPDELALALVFSLRAPEGAEPALACLQALCDERAPSMAEQGMELACSMEPGPDAVVGRARITGIGRALDHWATRMEQEVAAARARQEAQPAPLPAPLPDLPDDF
ncbi:MAG: hypothetical protein ABIO70_37205 [Pseudomonadota bacterium]